MVAYSFKRRFVEPIRIGLGLPPLVLPPARPKRQTIRAERRHGRHARPGEVVQLYTAMRTKACEHIGDGICTDVQPIRITFGESKIVIARNRVIEADIKLHEFAVADGFDDWNAMRGFWKENHRDCSVFSGVIIYWQPIAEALMLDTATAEVEPIVESIKPLLAGHAPEIQSAVIAELLAIWLHGHQSLDPKKLSLRNLKQFREEMLHRHVEFVRELVEIYDRKPSEEPAQSKQ